MTEPKVGERVLLVPQAAGVLMNPHLPTVNAIGKSPYTVGAFGKRIVDAAPMAPGNDRTWPSWEDYTNTLVRKGYGVMVVREGKLEVGPAIWDTGD